MGIKLVTAPTLEPITLADVKAQCRIDDADSDTLITGAIIPAARAKAEQYMGTVLMQRTFDMLLDAFPGSVASWGDWWNNTAAQADVEFERPPAWNSGCTVANPLAIVSVKYIDAAGVQQTLDPAAYSLDDSTWPFYLLPAFDTDWPAARAQANAVTIRYTVGYDTADKIPGDVRSWLLLTAGFLWAQREAMVLDGKVAGIPGGFADSLLDPYRVFKV